MCKRWWSRGEIHVSRALYDDRVLTLGEGVVSRDACRARRFGEIKFGRMGGATPWGRGTLD